MVLRLRQPPFDRWILAASLSVLLPACVLAFGLGIGTVRAQSTDEGASRSSGEWAEFRKARYGSRPLLLHLRSGHERAVLMPEPISLLDDEQSLPGCAVEIVDDVVGFFATRDFERRPIRFLGKDSGTVYEFRVRASPKGFRQTLQIVR